MAFHFHSYPTVTAFDAAILNDIPWQAPDQGELFGIQLEGAPPLPEEAEYMAEVVRRARSEWRPGPYQYEFLRAITEATLGRTVIVYLYEPGIMAILGEADGPFPILGKCTSVDTREDDGLMQAYLTLDEPKSIPNEFGFDALLRLTKVTEGGAVEVNLGDLHRIEVVKDKRR